ncbi:MAG: YolD-like family protein [Paenisporosarcina sp.]
MLRDRGRIKWTAMMLPEHVRLLREWQEEEGHTKSVEVDEQQFEEWHYIISEAMADHRPLLIRFSNRTTTEEVLGYVHHVDFNRGMLRYVTENEATIWISFAAIKTISRPE